MPTHDFIQVRVFVDGEEATEYEDPSAIDEDNKCVRYIDTRPGQKFSIKATWLNGFRIRWADGLSCRVQKGDEYWYDQEWLTAGELLHNKGALTHPASIEISNSLFKDPNTSKEVLCDWALEGLEMSKLLLVPASKFNNLRRHASRRHCPPGTIPAATRSRT